MKKHRTLYFFIKMKKVGGKNVKKMKQCFAGVMMFALMLVLGSMNLLQAEAADTDIPAKLELTIDGSGSAIVYGNDAEYHSNEEGKIIQEFEVGTKVKISFFEKNSNLQEIQVNGTVVEEIANSLELEYEMTSEGIHIQAVFAEYVADSEVMPLADSITYNETITDSNGWKTSIFRVNGIYAFCVQSEHDTPWAGLPVTITESTNANLRKILWYGCKGPGAILSDNNDGYMITSQAASLAYSGTSIDHASFKNWYSSVTAKAAPPSGFKVYVAKPNAPHSDLQHLAYFVYTPTGTLTLSKTSTTASITSYHSLSGAVYEVFSNAACTTKVGTLTTTATGKSNTLTMEAGTYYLKEKTAPTGFLVDATVHKVTVVSGENTTVSVKDVPYGVIDLEKGSTRPDITEGNSDYSKKDAVYEIYTDAACTNSVLTMTTGEDGGAAAKWLQAGTYYAKEKTAPKGFKLDPTVHTVVIKAGEKTTIQVKDEPIINGKAQLIKSSANPGITEGNSCYSIAGAVYGVYSSSSLSGASRVGTFTTNASGESNILELLPGTYFVKELEAPKGFALSAAVIPVVVTAEQTAIVRVTDVPQMDPVGILLRKVDAETNQNQPQNSATLAGAQFTVKFYAGLYDADPATLGQVPQRTWVFETDEDAFCYYGPEWLVSGDKLYSNSTGYAALPIGTITVQETKASEGYLINPEVFVRKITSEGTAEMVNTYNEPIVPEKILKLDLVKKQEGTNLNIPGVEFIHTKPDGTTETLTTDSNGQICIKGLTRGTHTIQEKSAPDGYLTNGNVITFTVDENNKITLTSDIDNKKGYVDFRVTNAGNIQLAIYDKLTPYSITVHKENNEGLKLPGAEFTLYSDAACTKALQVGITDEEGILVFTDLQVGIKYYLKETKAPAGYRIPVDENGNEYVHEIYTESTPVEDKFTLYVNGTAYDSEASGMYTITGTKADRVVNITVINEIGLKLPNTGSAMMLPLSISGVILFLLGIRPREDMKKRKRNDNK